jgi:hypothetical protein
MKKCDELKAKFDEAYSDGEGDECYEVFKELVEAYKEHFGDLYEDMIHVVLNHVNASYMDYLDSMCS